MVIDTSVLLAVIFNEKHGAWCAQCMEENRGDLRMSTVNLAETLIRIQDRQPSEFSQIRDEILNSSIRWIPPTSEHAVIAARARMKYPLNLGDCFAYALAKSEGVPLMTLDGDFKRSDVRTVMPR